MFLNGQNKKFCIPALYSIIIIIIENWFGKTADHILVLNIQLIFKMEHLVLYI